MLLLLWCRWGVLDLAGMGCCCCCCCWMEFEDSRGKPPMKNLMPRNIPAAEVASTLPKHTRGAMLRPPPLLPPLLLLPVSLCRRLFAEPPFCSCSCCASMRSSSSSCSSSSWRAEASRTGCSAWQCLHLWQSAQNRGRRAHSQTQSGQPSHSGSCRFERPGAGLVCSKAGVRGAAWQTLASAAQERTTAHRIQPPIPIHSRQARQSSRG
jgi:hypothetical protein